MFDLLSIRKNILLLIITPSLIGTIILSSYFAIDKLNTAELNLKKHASLLASNVEMIINANYFSYQFVNNFDNSSESSFEDSLQNFFQDSLQNKQLIEKQLTQLNTTNSNLLAFGIVDQNNHLVVKSANDVFTDNLKRKTFPTEIVSKRINQHLYIYVPIKLTHFPTQSNLNSYYLSLVFDGGFIQLLLYKALLFSVLILIIVLTSCLIVASKISNKINNLNNSLISAKKNMQSNIDQATLELTQTLETIEVQNIEIDFARKQAIKINQVKSEFLANISHEIRTPMNGVIGFTNLLLKSNIDEIQNDYLITIRKSANQLLNIIEDILDFSKIEAGKMNLDTVLFSFHDCVEEVITLLSTHSMKKQIELVPLIYKNVPDYMLGDPTRVKQVLTNLISNAIKFTEKGSVVVRVLVEESSATNYLIRTTITDTGMGMTDEQISKLFQPFSQVNQKINRHHSGTGLGLVISKKLIEQMEGTISIESKSNEGTSFSFTFRAQKPLEQSTKLPADLTPKLNFSEQQVYLYDYHPMALLAMKQLLLSWSMTVSTYQNIDKLIRAVQLLKNKSESELENSKPIIIIGLPNKNNDIVNKIQHLIKTNHFDSKFIGILFIGHLEHHNRSEALMNNSLLHYLEKPLTRKQLKTSFKKMGLLANEHQIAIKPEPLEQLFSGLRILVVDDNSDNLK
ncbi:MAG: signal transduction histidine kinase, partial [Enterobacterales bacterium]